MFIQPAQFFYENTQWTNVPEGTHALLAHAYDFRGLSAFSTAMHITVLPPLPPRSVSGTHEAIGPPRPALKPEQVRIMHRPPRRKCQVVGTATARAPGRWSFDVASAELKKQAAQLGANWVILNESHWVNPINKKTASLSSPKSIFQERHCTCHQSPNLPRRSNANAGP